MAIDTPQKRYSAMRPLASYRGMAIVPSGTVDQGERQAAAFLYSGIAAGPPAISTAKFLLLLGVGQVFSLTGAG